LTGIYFQKYTPRGMKKNKKIMFGKSTKKRKYKRKKESTKEKKKRKGNKEGKMLK